MAVNSVRPKFVGFKYHLLCLTDTAQARGTNCLSWNLHHSIHTHQSDPDPVLNATPFQIPFWRAKYGEFHQEEPQLRNQFDEDPILSRYISLHAPPSTSAVIEADLRAFGDRVVNDLLRDHLECEATPPRLETFDAWGKRVNRLITGSAWRRMKRVSAEEGLVAIAYENETRSWSRLHQMAKCYLFAPSSGLFGCPLSMTDGAAKIIAATGMTPGGTDLTAAFTNLTTRDPDRFWTSGQWMTEKKGGSDVGSGCETLAIPQSDGSFRLHGFKWFSSATDSDMAMTLARIVEKDGTTMAGSKGLSMFYLKVRDGTELNGIDVCRLKNKLGTRQLPTAELLLDGTKALLASEPGRGVASISPMLAVTRLHNSLTASATMRRIVNAAKDYACRRVTFGRAIIDHPLHARTLAHMEVETRAATTIVFETARHLGIVEAGARESLDLERSDLLLRILTPLIKLYTAKQAMAVVSEGLESLGGQGYIEDTGYPAYLRDAQVLTIWEGTTNVLSHDLLRAMSKTKGKAVEAFFAQVQEMISSEQAQNNPVLREAAVALSKSVSTTASFILKHQTDRAILELAARDLAYSLTRIYAGASLVDFAGRSGDAVSAEVARRWCCPNMADLADSATYSNQATKMDRDIVMDCLGV